MVKEIAVFVGAEGDTASLAEPGKVAVFRRAQGTWELDREREFSVARARGMQELRLKMGELLVFLGGCWIFVARSATGVPYFELEKAGRSVWEVPGRPEEFLDRVWESEEEERAAAQATQPAAMPVPVEISPGNYYISIKEIQEKNADISSKQVLRQFICEGKFRTLAVTCGHVPSWIEVEAMRCGLAVRTEQQGKSEFSLRIARQ